MYGPPTRQLYATHESALLQEALKKHAHRIDWADGIRRHRPAEENTWEGDWTSGVPATPKQRTLFVPPLGTDRRGRGSPPTVLGKPRPRSKNAGIVHHGPAGNDSRGARPSSQGSRARALIPLTPEQQPGALLGKLHLQIPDFHGGTVKAEITGMFDANMDERVIQRFLARKCRWTPSPVLGIGDWGKHTPPTPRSKFEHLDFVDDLASFSPRGRSREQSPDREHPLGRETPQRRGFRLPVFTGNTADSALDWAFLRHIPGADQWTVTSRGAKKLDASMAGAHQDQKQLHAFHSEVSVLLQSRNPKSSLPDFFGDRDADGLSSNSSSEPSSRPQSGQPGGRSVSKASGFPLTVLELIRLVPFPTLARWQRILKPAETSEEAVAKRAARVLSQRKKWFQVVGRSGILDMHSTIEYVGDIRKRSLTETVSAVPVARKECWLGVLAVATNLGAALDCLSQALSVELSYERLGMVMCAVERAASYKLSGEPSAFRGVELTLCTPTEDSSAVPEPRRGFKGITAEWVIRVLSEAPDEDRLEDGESVRLLTQVVSSMVGADSFTEEAWLNLMSKFDLATSASPARNAALFGGAFDATSGRDPMSDSSPDDGLASYQAAAAPSPQHCSKRQHILVQAFRHIQPVVFKAAIVETAAVECGPLLLEMLLEVAASAMDMAGGSEELSCMMLWELVGWDSPKARRTLRELCRAFDRYARDGELSSSGFTKFCLDVGWANNRDNATKSARFASIFEDVAGTEVQGAHFIEFLVMIETIMRDILRAQAERDDGTQVWQALQMAISRLLGSSGPRSKMAPLAKKKAPASPRHILPKGFWTEDIGFHIHDAFAHVADKAMSPPLAMPTTSTVDPLTLGHVLSKQTEEQENSEERSRQNEAQVLDDMHVEELDTAFDAHDVANAVQRVRRSAMQTHGEGLQYDDQPLLQHVFSAHEGRVCSSSDALVEQMTVAEARFRCLQLKGCQGFSFEGDPSTKEVVTVHFTKAWGDCEGEGWTSLKLAGEFVEEEQAEEDGPEANHATCDDKLQRHRVFERDSGADADSKGDETEEDLGEEEEVAEEVVDDLDVLPQVAVPTGDSCGWQSLAKASVVLPADGEDSGESMFGQSPTNLCNPVFVGASTDGASVAPTSHKEQPHISTRTVVIGSQADDSSRQKASRERDLKHLMDS